jgi:hypothetical protein
MMACRFMAVKKVKCQVCPRYRNGKSVTVA